VRAARLRSSVPGADGGYELGHVAPTRSLGLTENRASGSSATQAVGPTQGPCLPRPVTAVFRAAFAILALCPLAASGAWLVPGGCYCSFKFWTAASMRVCQYSGSGSEGPAHHDSDLPSLGVRAGQLKPQWQRLRKENATAGFALKNEPGGM
jgi:hypothetical protein